MWFPRLPCGSNIASWKPVNLRRESTPSAAPLSSPGPRGMSSLCRIMIFFQVRTFTLQSRRMQRGRTMVNVTPQQASGYKLSILNYLQSKVPGPKLLAGRLRTFHTHNARLPGHAESGQTQLPGPLQDVLPLHLVVNVVTVNPQAAEGVLRRRSGRIFLWSWCCW